MFVFVTDLVLSRVDGQWRLDEPLLCLYRNDSLEVPRGFTTDLDSVPRIPIVYAWLKGRATKSAVLHDYLYARQRGRKYADRVFLAAMAEEGVAVWRRYPIYLAVRAAGWAVYNRRR